MHTLQRYGSNFTLVAAKMVLTLYRDEGNSSPSMTVNISNNGFRTITQFLFLFFCLKYSLS